MEFTLMTARKGHGYTTHIVALVYTTKIYSSLNIEAVIIDQGRYRERNAPSPS
ncbi:unnamed protein product [Fusarium venenatum]|uniref:Uncharacterized protein n=1 Tax=Fusarium venenatum TaxID=56646 RepID=A0A2L2T4N6_9HYPO|nr:uncharacterized protein FVRRES_12940 [Fusarium venenatum]CEI40249.1 unnamed protein product [Fusarium venenatum]